MGRRLFQHRKGYGYEEIKDFMVSGNKILAISMIADTDLRPVLSQISCILFHVESGRIVSRNWCPE